MRLNKIMQVLRTVCGAGDHEMLLMSFSLLLCDSCYLGDLIP